MLESIDVISDVVCPWCYIGKRHLEAALDRYRALHPDAAVPAVNWHAFQLNPDMPAEGMDRRDYLERKFGGPQRAAEIYARVTQAGTGAGIAFDFGRMQVQPNTTQAHRLIAWAGTQDRQGQLVDALFQGYFIEARDFTKDDVLADLAAAAGLDRADALAFLASDELRDDVAADEKMARQIGVQGVPFFIFNRRLACSGAQPPDVLVDAMEEAAATAAN